MADPLERLDRGASALDTLADKATGADVTAQVESLAKLSPIEYDRRRDEVASALGIRVGTLDAEVGKVRGSGKKSDDPVQNLEPWPHPVSGPELLDSITAAIRRFIVCNSETAEGAALWVAMTWFMDVVQVAPLAVITAPEKRCGKSQLLNLLSRLSRRPVSASSISPAALYRCIEAWEPTLLIDEADAFMRENEELRGIINSGHTRTSAYVIRTVGDAHEPARFSTWSAKAIAGIGSLADTIEDRSVKLELRRKLPHETVERLRHAEAGLFDELAAKLARFAQDSREAVRKARPALPEQLNDRAQDNWEPLLAIADAAGGHWPKTAYQAALALSGKADDTTGGAELLTDIRDVFSRRNLLRIGTSALIESLCSDDEAPWATYNRGRPMSPRQLSRKLEAYGIKSKNIRNDGTVCKGFELSQFEDVFARYLATPPNCATPLQNAAFHRQTGVAVKGTVAATPPEPATSVFIGKIEKCSGVAANRQVPGKAVEYDL